MSYLVFARKWRPLTFEDVVGQQHITDTLKRAIEKDRVAHAYIFTGTRGVGKTTSARILARALNCDNGPTPNPCGKCESCLNIINGSSFDVMEIDGASNNGVDNIRELRDNLNYNSMGGKYRIIVIDEVHMLSKGAFNALLKTLEEPPKNVIFIFATTEPQKIPDTIHSRCQRYDFRRISTEHIAGQLERICTKEQISFDKGGLTLIARRADGSMRDSLSLLDQVYSFCSNGINETEVRSVLGLVEMDVYNTILDAAAENNPAPAILAVEDVLNRGFDLLEFVTGFQEYLRTLLFTRLPGVLESQRIDISRDTVKLKTETASRFSEGDLLRMAEMLKKCEAEMRWSAYPRFLVETALLKIVYMDRTVTIQSVIESIKSGEVPNDPSLNLPSHLESIKKKTKEISSSDKNTEKSPEIQNSSDFVNPFKQNVEKDSAISASENSESNSAAPSVHADVLYNEESKAEKIEENSPDNSEREEFAEQEESVIPSDNYPDPAYHEEIDNADSNVETSVVETNIEDPNTVSPEVLSNQDIEKYETYYSEEDTVNSDQVAEKPLNSPTKEEMASANPPEIEKESFQPAQKVAIQDISSKWKEFIELVSEDKINLGTFLSAGKLVAVNEESLDIRFPSDMAFQHQEVSKAGNRDFLQQKIVEFTGKSMELRFTVGTEVSKPIVEDESGEEKKEEPKEEKIVSASYAPSLEDDIEKEPIIKDIIKKFDGKVL